MFDGLTNSADGLFILLYIIALVVFFLFGPHKIYESLFWALIWLGLYLFVHEMTFIYPEITRSIFLGNLLVENRGTILWASKWLVLILFFVTPITLGLNVSGVVRGTLWFFLKTIVLSIFFICFGVILFSLLSTSGEGIFWEVVLFPKSLAEMPYFQNSQFFTWIVDKSAIIILWAFVLALYKIIFSHWVSRLLFIGGVLYIKSNEIFAKKKLDSVMPEMEHSEHDENIHYTDEHN